MERERQLKEELEYTGSKEKLISSGFLNKLIQDTGWEIEV